MHLPGPANIGSILISPTLFPVRARGRGGPEAAAGVGRAAAERDWGLVACWGQEMVGVGSGRESLQAALAGPPSVSRVWSAASR
jgi:hypothetical protein